MIEPDIKSIEKYDEMIDFLFSIQDFYIYNQQAYEDMVECINNFFIVYEDILKNGIQTNQLFSIAEKNMYNSINHLHSFIYSIPNDDNIRNKLHTSLYVLEKILNNYLNEIYDIHIDNIKKGYHIDYKLINIGPKEYNYYNEENTNFNYII